MCLQRTERSVAPERCNAWPLKSLMVADCPGQSFWSNRTKPVKPIERSGQSLINGARPWDRVPEESFTIYGTPKGYLAVTNPVRQHILKALEGGGKTLTDLVDLTGKAKSTLSAVHLRDLIDGGLVTEEAHRDDSRVKVYRLAGRRIGSSSVPVEDLREAVRNYATSAQGGMALPLASILEAFERLPAPRPEDAPWIGLVGERLGALASGHLKEREPGALLREVAEVWRHDRLGTVKVRPGAAGIELRHAKGARAGGARCSFIGGFLQGALTTRAGRATWVEHTACAGNRGTSCRFDVTWTKP